MPGYQISPGTIVNNIKSLLRERYKQGFPIIKEIIQNANDGQATTLEFGIVKGLSDLVEHPLLKIPALFFLNNGTFSKSDQEAISCFGIDANAKDKGKIGKFGLGQKSIFHFCEAFFYIARSQDIPEGCGEFINPWADHNGSDSKRPEWGEISAGDRQFLESYLIQQNLVQGKSSYFLLWIPLRVKMADDRCILANYYNNYQSVESQLPEDMEMRIGQLLPLLRHIRNVRYWLEHDQGSLQTKFSVSLDHNSFCKRCVYPNSQTQIIQEDQHELQGKILISSNPAGINFAGKERILPAKDFLSLINVTTENSAEVPSSFWHDLQQSSFWTKRISINELAESESIPDKSIPHCAVVFTKLSINTRRCKARLMLQWSVFLPLASDDNSSSQEAAEQEAYEVIDCTGDQDYTVFLHGYFFLDSGRKYIEGLQKIRTGTFTQKTPTNDDEMIAQWNYLLATKGTLKLFLPSLAHFAQVHSLSTQDIFNLSEAISGSHFFRSKVYRQSVCSEYQWVFRIKPSGSGWELIPANGNVRSLPGLPPKWQVFSTLSNLATKYYLIDKQKPNLLLNEQSAVWQEQEIIDLLTSLHMTLLFAEPENINYLGDFLNENKNITKSLQIQTRLINIVQQGFRIIGIATRQQNKFSQSLKRIIELILPEKRLKIKKSTCSEQDIQLVLNELYEVNLGEILLINESFDSDFFPSNGCLNEQTTSVLTCLNQLLKIANYRAAIKEIIEQILEKSTSLETVLNLVSDIPLFFGYNNQQDKIYIYSYSLLKQLREKFLLFCCERKEHKSNLATAVKEALPKCELIFLDAKISRILGKTQPLKAVPKFDHQTCLELLAKKPALGNSNQRTNLLKELINYV